MNVRIGFVNTGKELDIDLGDVKVDDVKKDLSKQLGGSGPIELKDKSGRIVLASVERVAYVEIGTDSAEHRIGFVG